MVVYPIIGRVLEILYIPNGGCVVGNGISAINSIIPISTLLVAVSTFTHLRCYQGRLRHPGNFSNINENFFAQKDHEKIQV